MFVFLGSFFDVSNEIVGHVRLTINKLSRLRTDVHVAVLIAKALFVINNGATTL